MMQYIVTRWNHTSKSEHQFHRKFGLDSLYIYGRVRITYASIEKSNQRVWLLWERLQVLDESLSSLVVCYGL